MDREEFATNFIPHAPPDELVKLLAFQESTDGFFSVGFELTVEGKAGLGSWSKDEEFLDALMPFALANDSGSFYALWDDGSKKPTSQMPVVVFGDEGGEHVVAEDVRALLQLLCFDADPIVDWDRVIFYKGEDEQDSDAHEEYVEWLKSEFDLEGADPEQVIAQAEAKHKAAFTAWFARFCPD